MFWFSGSFTLRGILHRTAAVALIGISIYHTFYCLFSPRGNRDLREMVPLFKDFKDIFGMISYNLGRRDSHPRFGRFNFIEKFEYYAVAWGSFVMILTGAALWFPVEATILFPRWVLDIIRVVHGFEAILAFLAIIIWHMYNVHLNPEVFPMSRIWLNGPHGVRLPAAPPPDRIRPSAGIRAGGSVFTDQAADGKRPGSKSHRNIRPLRTVCQT